MRVLQSGCTCVSQIRQHAWRRQLNTSAQRPQKGIDTASFEEWIGKSKAVSPTATLKPRQTPRPVDADSVLGTQGLFGPAEVGVHSGGKTPVQQQLQSKAGTSKRKLFRSIYVPPKLKQSLDNLEIGWRKGRRRPQLIKEDDWKHACKETPVWRRRLTFLGAAKTPQSFSPVHPGVKEVCFIGRSNVGKSSVINALSRSSPARTEDKPGVTKTVNFYALEKSSVNVVDLPGYGFAFADEEEQKQWQQTAQTYIAQRETLKRIFVLLDARHGLKQVDAAFLKRLEQVTRVRYQVVLTKCDLVQLEDIGRRLVVLQQALAELPNAIKDVLVVSATSGAGMRVLRRQIMGVTGLREGGRRSQGTASFPSPRQQQHQQQKQHRQVREPAVRGSGGDARAAGSAFGSNEAHVSTAVDSGEEMRRSMDVTSPERQAQAINRAQQRHKPRSPNTLLRVHHLLDGVGK